MLDSCLKSDLIELLVDNFNSAQMDEIGCMIMSKYCAHDILGVDDHITVSKRRASSALVDHCMENKCIDKLLQFIIEVDGGSVLGKKVIIENLDNYLNKLAKAGLVYDEKKRKIVAVKEDISDMPNWGTLREGKKYEVTVASIDIVGNSVLVKEHGLKKMEKCYYRFWTFLRRILAVYNGRIWHWAGDGGLIAFTSKNHPTRAVQCALEIQSILPIFNSDPEKPIEDDIVLRIGMDMGRIKFSSDTGRIVSDTINFAAHLEKSHTQPGEVALSAELLDKLPPKLMEFFYAGGQFEGRTVYTTSFSSNLN